MNVRFTIPIIMNKRVIKPLNSQKYFGVDSFHSVHDSAPTFYILAKQTKNKLPTAIIMPAIMKNPAPNAF